jgi:hypothetical protein
MQNMEPESQTAATKRVAKSPLLTVPLSERAAFTPNEFGALFGKRETWAYRLAYAGKIKVIRHLGRMMIPRSELERVNSEASEYVPKEQARAQRKVKEALA